MKVKVGLRLIILWVIAWLNCSLCVFFPLFFPKTGTRLVFVLCGFYHLTQRGRGSLMLWARAVTILALWLLRPCQLKASTGLHLPGCVTHSPLLVHFSSSSGFCFCVCVWGVRGCIQSETAGLSNLTYLSVTKCSLKRLARWSFQRLLWFLEDSGSERCWIFHNETKTLTVPTGFRWGLRRSATTIIVDCRRCCDTDLKHAPTSEEWVADGLEMSTWLHWKECPWTGRGS